MGSDLVDQKFRVYYDSRKCKQTEKFTTYSPQSRGMNERMGVKP
jgi:hypothetical protein